MERSGPASDAGPRGFRAGFPVYPERLDMKAVFVGGGSFRTLPIIRGALQTPGLLDNGELVLVDFNRDRAEAVAALIRRAPETARAGLRVSVAAKIERALPGADLVHVGFPCGSVRACVQFEDESVKAGLIPSDQLSIAGAFRAAVGGPALHAVARAVEKYAPDAWIADFANPVAVYSGIINNHTKAKGLGICGGFNNHRWDLTRLLEGRDSDDDLYRIAVAGVNHLSYILRGTWRGKDLYAALDKVIANPDWRPCSLPTYSDPRRIRDINTQLRKLLELRRRFGYTVFSTEGDGMMHLFWEEHLRANQTALAARKPLTRAAAAKIEARLRAEREKQDAWYRERAKAPELPAKFWDGPAWKNPYFAATPNDAAVAILRGISPRGGRVWLAASRPNRGAVRGFKDRTVLEYSMTLEKGKVTPDPDLEVPDCFYGLTASLAAFQTMLADAIATRDPKLFAAALSRYPMAGETKAAKKLFRRGAEIFADEIPAEFRRLGDYL